MEFVELSGVGRIKVRRGRNIRYLRIRMAPERGIWVSVPYGISRRQVDGFLEENRNWILQNREKMEEHERKIGMKLQIGSEVRTKLHLLKIVAARKMEPSFRVEQDSLVLEMPEKWEPCRVEEFVRCLLPEIYALESRRYLPPRVEHYAGLFGFRYGRLSFRNNISNWGSCSFGNNISLNINLMKLPDEIIDYVILHELCHTVEKNHSAQFWKLVGKVCPNYAVLRNRLRKYAVCG